MINVSSNPRDFLLQILAHDQHAPTRLSVGVINPRSSRNSTLSFATVVNPHLRQDPPTSHFFALSVLLRGPPVNALLSAARWWEHHLLDPSGSPPPHRSDQPRHGQDEVAIRRLPGFGRRDLVRTVIAYRPRCGAAVGPATRLRRSRPPGDRQASRRSGPGPGYLLRRLHSGRWRGLALYLPVHRRSRLHINRHTRG